MRAPSMLTAVFFTILVITLVALPGGATHAQGSADLSLEQQIQAALANAGFDPGPADGKLGQKTRRAIGAWQRANGHAATGFLTKEQLRTILTKTTPAVTLEPKCADLPGRYLGENHAECWEEIENQPGCFLWRDHYHSDQTTKWTGECRRRVAEGRGMYSISAGSEHSSFEGTGMLVNSKANGRWVVSWGSGDRYEGEFSDGERHGYGTYTWPDGGRYEGEWHDTEQHGFGSRTWPNGDRYEGEWRDGKVHGRGTYNWANGDRYEGEWRDDKRTGRGTLTWANGNRYEGQLRDNKRTGFGTYTWPNGDRYEGQLRDNKPHGYGTYTLADGTRSQGQWRDGCFGERNRKWAVVNTTKAACGF